MTIKTLDELRQADERTLHFTPMGLGLGIQMRPDDAAEYQQKVVAQFDLAPSVAEGTRQSFEHLRTVYAYGVLCYEIYTLVRDQALLVIEQALRDRFVDFHQGTATFVDSADCDRRVPVSRYEDVQEFLTHRPRGRGWRLRLPNGAVMPFAGGMLGDLRTWARKVGLLRGQRNRGIERALSNLRNFVAHPTNYHLGGPVDAAGTLRDLAEIINQLWGVPTPGGRLYPAPLRREVTVITWPTDGTAWHAALAAEAFTDFIDPEDRQWECAIVRAVFQSGAHGSDPDLSHYDSRAEATWYPTELLWGPGSITDAAAWYNQNLPEPDECDYLDRVFMLRHDGANLYMPMRPEVAGALPDQDRTGTWHTVKADHPNDAYHHIRNRVTRAGCQDDGECRQCHAESLGSGPLHTALAHAGLHADSAPALPSDVRVPWSHPRFQQIT